MFITELQWVTLWAAQDCGQSPDFKGQKQNFYNIATDSSSEIKFF